MPFLGLPFESTDPGRADSIANGTIARMRHPRFVAIKEKYMLAVFARHFQICKPLAQSQIARRIATLTGTIFWEAQTRSRLGFPQRFPGPFLFGGRHRPLK